jgi:hypothetical protein
MACGTPVVARAAEGPGRAGRRQRRRGVPTARADSFAERDRERLPRERSAPRAARRERAESYDWNQMLPLQLMHYRQLLREGPRKERGTTAARRPRPACRNEAVACGGAARRGAVHAACVRARARTPSREVADVPLTLLARAALPLRAEPARFVRLAATTATCAATSWRCMATRTWTRRAAQPRRPPEARHYTRGEGEFADLSMTEALRRITAGVRWFARQGFVLRGFVAPAWLMSQGTWEALRWADLRYTCTLRRWCCCPSAAIAAKPVRRLQQLERVAAPGVERCGTPPVASMERHNPLLRLELHPGDCRPCRDPALVAAHPRDGTCRAGARARSPTSPIASAQHRLGPPRLRRLRR